MTMPVAIEAVGKRCTGCEVCVSVCPAHALHMEQDNEGFFYPVVQDGLCTRCGLCTRRCPVASSSVVFRHPLPSHAYAGGLQDKKERLFSASGGAFPALAAAGKADTIYGAAWSSPDTVQHVRVNLQGIAALRGSKYIQSHMDDAYCQVSNDLKNGLRVLFSGTPCQVAGLMAFLGKPDPALTTVEIMCHGIASPGLFQQYLSQLGKKYGSPVQKYCFREKSILLGNWEFFHSAVRCDDGHTHHTYYEPFTQLFLSRCILRPSCEHCPFSGETAHPADVILGDYWGCSSNDPELYHKYGVSALIPLTEKGQELIRQADSLELTEIPLNHVTEQNGVLLQHKPYPPERAAFFALLEEKGLFAAVQKFSTPATWKSKLKPYLRPFIKHLRG